MSQEQKSNGETLHRIAWDKAQEMLDACVSTANTPEQMSNQLGIAKFMSMELLISIIFNEVMLANNDVFNATEAYNKLSDVKDFIYEGMCSLGKAHKEGELFKKGINNE